MCYLARTLDWRPCIPSSSAATAAKAGTRETPGPRFRENNRSPVKHRIALGPDHHERRALRYFLELGRADIGHHRAYAAADLLHRGLDAAAIGHLDRLAFRRTIVGDAAVILVHRRLRRHTVKLHGDRDLFT